MTSTNLERIYIQSGAQPTTPKEIEQQIERERKYRLHLSITEPDPAQRRMKLRASTLRTEELRKRKV